jgi:PhnB protein
MRLNTYINFNGNCAAALDFYVQHLGGKITEKVPYMTGPNMPPDMKGCVMHARIEIAGVLLMASDSPADRYAPMGSTFIAISVDSNEEAERIYAALADGGHVTMKMEETFFAHRFAMFTDKFRVNWMVIHEKKMG